MEDSYLKQEKEFAPQLTNEDILAVQCGVFFSDIKYVCAEAFGQDKIAILEKIAEKSGHTLEPEERARITQEPVAQYVAERGPLFRFFATHISDPETLRHFKKAAETHDPEEIAAILSSFEEFRVQVESSIAKEDPVAWNSLVRAVEEIHVHPWLQRGINNIFEEYLQDHFTATAETQKGSRSDLH